jgi:two-component system sensor histidine kinase RpfC
MIPTPARFVTGLRERLARRSDTEHEMLLNKIVISTVLMTIVLAFAAGVGARVANVAAIFAIFIAGCVTLLASVLIWPGANRARRAAGIALDVGALGVVQHVGGPGLAGFAYFGYLLVIFGNGFRFGGRFLTLSAAASIVALGANVMLSPDWETMRPLGHGLVLGLLIFPAYAYKLIRGLTEARAHAEETARAKRQFLASVSHEFRTPLNAVIGLGDLLANSPLPPTELSWARTIAVAGRSLLDQINSILDFSRLEAGQLPLQHEPFDIIALASDARDMLSPQARAKSLAFGLHVHMPVIAGVVASPRLLRDALVNLLANAIRFTPSGYVVLTITPISRTPRSQTLRFEVIDSGIGIEAVALDRIFDRFAQADASIADRFGGTGLGLAIVRQLVAAMNGQLGVSSKVGRGSRFWFEIPLELDLSDPCREADTAPPPPETDGIVSPLIETKDDRLHRPDPGKFLFLLGADASVRERHEALALANRYRRLRIDQPAPPAPAARPLRVLVAEDNATNQMVIERVLAGAGHRVVLVEDGRAALAGLAAEPFDVVLMDLNMPVLTATKPPASIASGRPPKRGSRSWC